MGKFRQACLFLWIYDRCNLRLCIAILMGINWLFLYVIYMDYSTKYAITNL